MHIPSPGREEQTHLDAQIDVFCDTESKVASLGKVSLPQFVLLYFQATLEDLLRLWSPDSNVYSNLFVSSDAERSDGISSLGGDWRLSGELFEDLGGTSKSVTGFSHGDVWI